MVPHPVSPTVASRSEHQPLPGGMAQGLRGERALQRYHRQSAPLLDGRDVPALSTPGVQCHVPHHDGGIQLVQQVGDLGSIPPGTGGHLGREEVGTVRPGVDQGVELEEPIEERGLPSQHVKPAVVLVRGLSCAVAGHIDPAASGKANGDLLNHPLQSGDGDFIDQISDRARRWDPLLEPQDPGQVGERLEHGVGLVVRPSREHLEEEKPPHVTGGGRETSGGPPGAGRKGGRCRSDQVGNGVEDPDGAMEEEVAVTLVVPPVGTPALRVKGGLLLGDAHSLSYGLRVGSVAGGLHTRTPRSACSSIPNLPSKCCPPQGSSGVFGRTRD